MKPDKELDAMNAAFGALSKLDADERVRVLEWLMRRLDVGGPSSKAQATLPAEARNPAGAGWARPVAGGTPSARDFVAEKRPVKDIERVACLAYYLTHFRGLAVFKTRDLTKLNDEAKQPKFSNAAVAVANATRQSQYLAPVGGGKKQITVRGESLVEALPERERATEALAANPMVGRKRHGGPRRGPRSKPR